MKKYLMIIPTIFAIAIGCSSCSNWIPIDCHISISGKDIIITSAKLGSRIDFSADSKSINFSSYDDTESSNNDNK